MVKTLGEMYQQYAVTLEEEEAWAMKTKTENYHDYSGPMLELKRMLAEYDRLLLERRWVEALEMAPDLHTQVRLLTQTVRLNAEGRAS